MPLLIDDRSWENKIVPEIVGSIAGNNQDLHEVLLYSPTHHTPSPSASQFPTKLFIFSLMTTYLSTLVQPILGRGAHRTDNLQKNNEKTDQGDRSVPLYDMNEDLDLPHTASQYPHEPFIPFQCFDISALFKVFNWTNTTRTRGPTWNSSMLGELEQKRRGSIPSHVYLEKPLQPNVSDEKSMCKFTETRTSSFVTADISTGTQGTSHQSSNSKNCSRETEFISVDECILLGDSTDADADAVESMLRIFRSVSSISCPSQYQSIPSRDLSDNEEVVPTGMLVSEQTDMLMPSTLSNDSLLSFDLSEVSDASGDQLLDMLSFDASEDISNEKGTKLTKLSFLCEQSVQSSVFEETTPPARPILSEKTPSALQSRTRSRSRSRSVKRALWKKFEHIQYSKKSAEI